MRYLILADRPADELLPITNHLSPPMLPVAGRPVIEHALTLIATRGGGRVDVVLSLHDTQTSDFLEATQWPTLDIHILRGPAKASSGWRLAIRGDVCPHPEDLERAIASCRDKRPMRSLAKCALAVVAPGEPPPSWRVFVNAVKSQEPHAEPWRGLFFTLEDYHELALSAVARRLGLAGVTPSGWLEHDGTRVGIGARIKTRRKLGHGISLGSRVVVGADVTMASGAVIGDDCFIGDSAHVERSIILDDTFVGSGLKITDAIVAGRWIYHVGYGTASCAPKHFLRPRFA